eukprot:TRINITY_DN3679_c0_g1_i2.p1 TRINITY_DN3679_c0_g1~~TRINITY_DN3679_c0_g1_i2.p1  ORF type:complete len:426 (-),score=85.90 TRINITY_DN3679_c0_g1_i2:355-1632(-)
MEEDDKSPTYNRSFQKKEVVKKLVKDEACAKIATPLEIPESFLSSDSGYLCYIYDVVENKEYEEGFGPRVVVNIGSHETIWKRSRNKWNPFEKIRTVSKETENSSNFKISWDKNGLNSYYVTERMYYYLDKDKHKEKFKSIRAKLYITRMHQEGAKRFLLQFIMDKMTEAEQEQQKRIQKLKEEKRLKKQQTVRKDTKPTNLGLMPSDYDQKYPDSDMDMRVAAFQTSPTWNKYPYPYLHDAGYRNTFPPANPHPAYSLGRHHSDYSDASPTPPEYGNYGYPMVHCPTPVKATTSIISHMPMENNQCTPNRPTIHFPCPRSFHSYQPRPKSVDFSFSGTGHPLTRSSSFDAQKRPCENDPLERLKANFLSSSPAELEQQVERSKVTLPPISSFLSNNAFHEMVRLFLLIFSFMSCNVTPEDMLFY